MNMERFETLLAQAVGIVPTCPAGGCGWNELLQLANNLITFFFRFGAIVASLLIAYAGWLYITSGGDSSKVSQAKGMFIKILIGFIVMLSAYLVVKLILQVLGYQGDPNINIIDVR